MTEPGNILDSSIDFYQIKYLHRGAFMKYFILSIACAAICFLSPICSRLSAGDKSAEDYKEVVGTVCELDQGGRSFQVGDYMISNFKTVWEDNGSGKISQVGIERIKAGEVVKAYLIKEDENGFWTADRIVILSGRALDSKVKNQAGYKEMEVTNPPAPSEKKPVLDNGVWKN